MGGKPLLSFLKHLKAILFSFIEKICCKQIICTNITYLDLAKNNDFIWSSLGGYAFGCRAIDNN